jgi:hypothetical protein
MRRAHRRTRSLVRKQSIMPLLIARMAMQKIILSVSRKTGIISGYKILPKKARLCGDFVKKRNLMDDEPRSERRELEMVGDSSVAALLASRADRGGSKGLCRGQTARLRA